MCEHWSQLVRFCPLLVFKKSFKFKILILYANGILKKRKGSKLRRRVAGVAGTWSHRNQNCNRAKRP